jgi:hypothetical protein
MYHFSPYAVHAHKASDSEVMRFAADSVGWLAS